MKKFVSIVSLMLCIMTPLILIGCGGVYTNYIKSVNYQTANSTTIQKRYSCYLYNIENISVYDATTNNSGKLCDVTNICFDAGYKYFKTDINTKTHISYNTQITAVSDIRPTSYEGPLYSSEYQTYVYYFIQLSDILKNYDIKVSNANSQTTIEYPSFWDDSVTNVSSLSYSKITVPSSNVTIYYT